MIPDLFFDVTVNNIDLAYKKESLPSSITESRIFSWDFSKNDKSFINTMCETICHEPTQNKVIGNGSRFSSLVRSISISVDVPKTNTDTIMRVKRLFSKVSAPDLFLEQRPSNNVCTQ
uniref:Ovule protein n=1 Tax=Rhabditophanes sp. KR3021 TaxID=114890 RepID=A0AC35UEE4_9BILA